MPSNKVYKIKNVKTGEYIRLGSNSKGTWMTFPSEAIKYALKDELSKQDDFEVEMCEFVVTKKFTLHKKEIKWLTREVLFEKVKEENKPSKKRK